MARGLKIPGTPGWRTLPVGVGPPDGHSGGSLVRLLALEAGRDDLLGGADAYPEIGVSVDFMEARETWTRSASGLLAELTAIAEDTIGTASRHWPKRADTLSNRLVQHAPLLGTHGLEIAPNPGPLGHSLDPERPEPGG
jgi:hypothetical protein